MILLKQEKTDIIKFHTYKTITQFRNKRHLVVDTIPPVSPNFKFREEIHSFALILWVGVSYMIPKSIYYFVCLVLIQFTAMITGLTQAALVQVWSLVSESPSVM